MEKGVDSAGRHNTSDSKFIFVGPHYYIAKPTRQSRIQSKASDLVQFPVDQAPSILKYSKNIQLGGNIST